MQGSVKLVYIAAIVLASLVIVVTYIFIPLRPVGTYYNHFIGFSTNGSPLYIGKFISYVNTVQGLLLTATIPTVLGNYAWIKLRAGKGQVGMLDTSQGKLSQTLMSLPSSIGNNLLFSFNILVLVVFGGLKASEIGMQQTMVDPIVLLDGFSVSDSVILYDTRWLRSEDIKGFFLPAHNDQEPEYFVRKSFKEVRSAYFDVIGSVSNTTGLPTNKEDEPAPLVKCLPKPGVVRCAYTVPMKFAYETICEKESYTDMDVKTANELKVETDTYNRTANSQSQLFFAVSKYGIRTNCTINIGRQYWMEYSTGPTNKSKYQFTRYCEKDECKKPEGQNVHYSMDPYFFLARASLNILLLDLSETRCFAGGSGPNICRKGNVEVDQIQAFTNMVDKHSTGNVVEPELKYFFDRVSRRITTSLPTYEQPCEKCVYKNFQSCSWFIMLIVTLVNGVTIVGGCFGIYLEQTYGHWEVNAETMLKAELVESKTNDKVQYSISMKE
ncbi:hypothetical protein HDV02_003171 [Globomyces sp. JEL0801]|nr:hypothetical protein HDV02_003171 [Globomyces sp. JEL0801]